MNLSVQLVFTFFVYLITLVQTEENSTVFQPQPLLGVHNLETNLKIKNDLFGRFIRLLFSESVTSKIPQFEPNLKKENRSSLLHKTFRPLNIFGLQSEPEAPTEKINDDFRGPTREVISIRKENEDQLTPNFYVVSPTSSIDIRSAANTVHYPKLTLDPMNPQDIDNNFQADFFENPIEDF